MMRRHQSRQGLHSDEHKATMRPTSRALIISTSQDEPGVVWGGGVYRSRKFEPLCCWNTQKLCAIGPLFAAAWKNMRLISGIKDSTLQLVSCYIFQFGLQYAGHHISINKKKKSQPSAFDPSTCLDALTRWTVPFVTSQGSDFLNDMLAKPWCRGSCALLNLYRICKP